MPPHIPIASALRATRAGNLAEATALIRAALSGADRAAIPRPATVREGGSFEARRHAGPAGTIDYMIYRPARATDAMPLVVMLHGCGQSPEDFARGTAMNRLADELGFLVAYPRQTQAANMQRCWNWFQPQHQRHGRGEPALIAGATRDVIAAERADSSRVYVAGLSAGGAAAAIMADAYPYLFAVAGIHSGLACGAARDLPSALAAMKRGAGRGAGAATGFVPIITFHGDRDDTVCEANARHIVRAATSAAGAPLSVETETGSAGGRRFVRAISRDRAGRAVIEQWTIAGAGHAWSGGDPTGSYADPAGPDASRAMLRFFLGHRRPTALRRA